MNLIQKIQAILQDARTDSFCLPLSSYLESDCSQEWQGEGDGQVEPQPLSQQPPHHRLWQRHGGSQHWEDKEDKTSRVITLPDKHVFLYF